MILDSEINPVLLSAFVGALSMFGKENLGRIKEIRVIGLDVDMIVVSKHGLVLIALMDKDFAKREIRAEGEKLLDLFYSMYEKSIEDCIEISQFKKFKEILQEEVQIYLDRINKAPKNQPIEDFGFFTKTIEKMRFDKLS